MFLFQFPIHLTVERRKAFGFLKNMCGYPCTYICPCISTLKKCREYDLHYLGLSAEASFLYISDAAEQFYCVDV